MLLRAELFADTMALAPRLGQAPAWAIPLGRFKCSLIPLPGVRLCFSARELLETCWELLNSCYFHSPAVFLLDVGDLSAEPDCGIVKEALLRPIKVGFIFPISPSTMPAAEGLCGTQHN